MRTLSSIAITVIAFVLPVLAQDQTVSYVEFVNVVGPDGTVECREYVRTQEYMDARSAFMKTSDLKVIPQTVGRRTRDGRLMKSQAGLDIVLRGTQQLIDNPAAVAAFAAAAARWEERLQNPIVVTMDVDYGPTRFGEAWSSSSVLGSTSSAVFSLNTTNWSQYAAALLAKNPQYSDIYNNIPDPLPNTTATAAPRPSGTLANLQALGFRGASEVLAFGSAPSIGFNSNFTFDLDPTDGISGGQTDFDGVAVHEIGHALGFVSVIGSTGSARTWDAFRFRPGAVKDTIMFKTAQRVLTPGPSSGGGDQVFWDGAREWEVSTATGSRTGGDGQQASHWRDDAQRTSAPSAERKIGIMDPNLASGVRDTMSMADLKALSLMGWIIDLGHKINPVEQLKTVSDHTTPTSVTLSWKNPYKDFGGYTLSNYKMLVYRNGLLHKELDSPPAGGAMSLVDSNLTQYAKYTYRFVPVHQPSNDTGYAVTITAEAGGSPRPGLGKFLSVMSNQSTVLSRFQAPTLHDDNTTLHNLAFVKFYRITQTQANAAESLAVTPADTGKVFTFIDTPGPRFLNNYNFLASFVGTASYHAEGFTVTTPTVKAGIVSSAEFKESFEASKASVVHETGWDSTAVSARSGVTSFGIRSYPNSYTGSAYIPMVRGNGSPTLTFWTVCRVDPSDTARVQVSKDKGKSWTTVLAMNKSLHPEWQAGTNTWMRKQIPLTGLNTDTILVRFQLTTDNAASDFGWLIDDVSLSPVLTGVSDDDAALPMEYSLEQNYPNPFNPATTVRYTIKEAGAVRVSVYDLLGKEVAVPVNDVKQRGTHQFTFNAHGLASGIYVYRLSANGTTLVRKMSYVR